MQNGDSPARPDPRHRAPDDADDLLGEVERRARSVPAPPHDAETGDVDLVRELMLDPERDPEAGKDVTLGGYMAKHDRPPAFGGADGQPYTVGLDVESTDDPDRPYAGFFVFLRWAETGAGIMSHVESGDVAFGATEEEARNALLELSLYEVKAELDAAIRRRDSEWEEPS